MTIGVTPLLNWAREYARIENSYIREIFAEFFGTFLLCLFAVGGTCQINASHPSAGFVYSSAESVIPVAFGYFIANLLFGGVSGAHVNPATSIGLAIVGKISWIKVHAFILSQFVGGYLGSLLGYGLFQSYIQNQKLGGTTQSIKNVPGSAALFNANAGLITIGSGFANEIVVTAIFMMSIIAVKDMWNTRAPRYVQGILIGLVVIGLSVSFGTTTGCSLNPVRDITPRLAAMSLGWSSASATRGFLGDNQWWAVGFFAPFIGAILGAFIYIFIIGAQLRTNDDDESDSGELVTVESSGNGMENPQHKWRATVFIPKLQQNRQNRSPSPYNQGVQFSHQ